MNDTTQGGGYQNPVLGTPKYKNATIIPPTLSPREMTDLYEGSWAARKFVDILPEDGTAKPREWDEGTPEELTTALNAEYKRLGLKQVQRDVLKAARLYGEAIVIAITPEDASNPELLSEPMPVLRPGSLMSVKVLTKGNYMVDTVEGNLALPNTNEPLIYRCSLMIGGWGQQLDIHASHVIPVYGTRDLSFSPAFGGMYRGGVSDLLYAFDAILQDATVMESVAELFPQLSIPVLKAPDLEEVRQSKDGNNTLQERGQQLDRNRSLYRILLLDNNEELERHNVTLSGLEGLVNRIALRLASIAGISATRFLSQSPVGENATGDGDARNDARTVLDYQETKLRPLLDNLDLWVTQNLGLSPVTNTYTFPSTYEVGEQDRADIVLKESQALKALVEAGIYTPAQAKEIIDRRFEGN